MSEERNIPTLTLDPAGDEAAAAAQAAPAAQAAAPVVQAAPVAQAAPAAPETAAPTLTLTPEAPVAQAVEDSAPPAIDESMLSEAERKIVDEFAQKIDITDSTQILQYGTAAQKNIASFSENALNKVRTKDLGEVGDVLSSLVVELKNNAPGTEKKRGFFQRSKIKMDEMRAQYQKAEGNVDNICRILEQHQVALMKDVAMFDQMFELNQQYYKELTMYIIAGKKKLEACRTGEMAQLRAKAEQTGAQEDAQAYNDYANLMERFDKKINDLELTRMISIQMGPQTRLLQNNDTLMIEKIQTSLVNTIPLWKSQMVLALGLERSRQATAAQSAVTNMTNELLRKNAEMLKMGTIATAKEAERGVVDIETLRKTNEELDLHPGRSDEDPDRRPPEAERGGSGADQDRRGSAAEAHGAETLRKDNPAGGRGSVRPFSLWKGAAYDTGKTRGGTVRSQSQRPDALGQRLLRPHRLAGGSVGWRRDGAAAGGLGSPAVQTRVRRPDRGGLPLVGSGLGSRGQCGRRCLLPEQSGRHLRRSPGNIAPKSPHLPLLLHAKPTPCRLRPSRH